MGNETSQLKGLVIEKKAIEVTDFYTLNLGCIPVSTTQKTKKGHNNQKGQKPNVEKVKEPEKQFLAVFQNDDPLQTNFIIEGQNPLSRAIRNIKIYRHPNILRYVAAWNNGTNLFLATENCKPLSSILSGLNDVQICLGLKSVLCAIIFLVEQAKARHLNISISSIYVNDEGQWKLFGFEHLWKASELTPAIVEKSATYRYKKATGKDEIKTNMVGIETYAFGVLCEDLLKQKKGNIPHTAEFREYCAKHLKHPDVTLRPSLQAVLLHPYFNHDFIQIHSYLTELPLKPNESKHEFFSTLLERLRLFDEEITASQLSSLLLSRLVLTHQTAKQLFIPYFLKPKQVDDIPEMEVPGLFSQAIFQKYLIPKIKQAFSMKDCQIRICLLEYFPSYVEMFEKDDLKHEILPQLLLGIKDTNDFLVSRTLLCMADLIPILGATQVVGGNRVKIFSDGRPGNLETQMVKSSTEPRSITPLLPSTEQLLSESPLPEPVDVSESLETNEVSQENDADVSSNLDQVPDNMPERLTPEGEEMEIPTASEVEAEDWSDWDNQEGNASDPSPKSIQNAVTTADNQQEKPTVPTQKLAAAPKSRAIKPDDIDELDIKNLTFKKIDAPEEFDFFKDMEPVIQKTNVVLVNKDAKIQEEIKPISAQELTPQSPSTRLTVTETTGTSEEHGWGEDDVWGE